MSVDVLPLLASLGLLVRVSAPRELRATWPGCELWLLSRTGSRKPSGDGRRPEHTEEVVERPEHNEEVVENGFLAGGPLRPQRGSGRRL